jgi:hypothetical protein
MAFNLAFGKPFRWTSRFLSNITVNTFRFSIESFAALVLPFILQLPLANFASRSFNFPIETLEILKTADLTDRKFYVTTEC